MDYHTAVKRKEFLTFSTAWIKLETIMLSEISQAVKDKCHMISPVMESNEQNKLMSKTEPEAQKEGTDRHLHEGRRELETVEKKVKGLDKEHTCTTYGLAQWCGDWLWEGGQREKNRDNCNSINNKK